MLINVMTASFGLHLRLSVLALSFSLAASVAMAGVQEDYDLGFKRYQEGDVVGAMTPLRRASGAGHLKSMVLLAEILDRSEFDEEAVGWYRKAAEQGELDGMFGYGAMLAAGEGVKKNPAEARRWMLKAAEAGHLQAANVIAEAYLRADLGYTEADRSSAEALRWIKAAAKNDFLPAVDALAEAYRTGRNLGIQPDLQQAEAYQTQANRIRQIDAKAKKKNRKSSSGN